MDMKLSSECLVGLKRLCNASVIDAETFAIITENCIVSVISEERPQMDFSKLSCKNGAKEAYAALAILIAECSRHDIDPSMVTEILESYNLNGQRISLIVEAYEKAKNPCQRNLSLIGHRKPEIIDVKWSLDYRLTKEAPFLEHVYTVQFITRDSNEIVTFACTKQNLEQLIYSLKDAARFVKKIAS